jgi:hypothetical protein
MLQKSKIKISSKIGDHDPGFSFFICNVRGESIEVTIFLHNSLKDAERLKVRCKVMHDKYKKIIVPYLLNKHHVT